MQITLEKFSSAGVRQCYNSLLKLSPVHDDRLLQKIISSVCQDYRITLSLTNALILRTPVHLTTLNLGMNYMS